MSNVRFKFIKFAHLVAKLRARFKRVRHSVWRELAGLFFALGLNRRRYGHLRYRRTYAVRWKRNLSNLDFSTAVSRLAAAVLLFGLLIQAAGPAATLAYYDDYEVVGDNGIAAGGLDFSLSAGDWLPANTAGDLQPGDSVTRSVSVAQASTLNFDYGATSQMTSGDQALCDALNIKAEMGGDEYYNGPLLGMNFSSPASFTGSQQDWIFTATLPPSVLGVEGLSCEFSLTFDGYLPGSGYGVGFFDREIAGDNLLEAAAGEEVYPALSPISDAYVDENAPDTEHPHSNLLVRSKSGNDNQRTYVKFNFNLPPGTTVNSAMLKLFMFQAPTADRTYQASRVVGGDWNEETINWTNQPAAAAVGTDSLTTGTANNIWQSWNVTTDVAGFASGTDSNYGWSVKDNSESATASRQGQFRSREEADFTKRPVLELAIVPPVATTTHPVINEIYYDVQPTYGNDQHNEWVEIYNPTDSPADISGWSICDSSACDVIPASPAIPAKGFAVVTRDASTWGYWPGLPAGTIKIELGSQIGNGLNDSGDAVSLKNGATVIDAMSYGGDASVFDPAAPDAPQGLSLARIIKGYDTDTAAEWIINARPNPGVNPGVGQEVFRFTGDGLIMAATAEDLPPLAPDETIANLFSHESSLESFQTTADVLPASDNLAPISDQTNLDEPTPAVVDDSQPAPTGTEAPASESLAPTATPTGSPASADAASAPEAIFEPQGLTDEPAEPTLPASEEAIIPPTEEATVPPEPAALSAEDSLAPEVPAIEPAVPAENKPADIISQEPAPTN